MSLPIKLASLQRKRLPERLPREPGLQESRSRRGFVQSRGDRRKKLNRGKWLSLLGRKLRELSMPELQLRKNKLDLKLRLARQKHRELKPNRKLAGRKNRPWLPNKQDSEPSPNRRLVRKRRQD